MAFESLVSDTFLVSDTGFRRPFATFMQKPVRDPAWQPHPASTITGWTARFPKTRKHSARKVII
jgi:hypothetical protein